MFLQNILNWKEITVFVNNKFRVYQNILMRCENKYLDLCILLIPCWSVVILILILFSSQIFKMYSCTPYNCLKILYFLK